MQFGANSILRGIPAGLLGIEAKGDEKLMNFSHFRAIIDHRARA